MGEGYKGGGEIEKWRGREEQRETEYSPLIRSLTIFRGKNQLPPNYFPNTPISI